MKERLQSINDILTGTSGVKIIVPFEYDDSYVLKGTINLTYSDFNNLDFEVYISPQYPLQFRQQEAIKFKNQSLSEFGHVGEDGGICIHTTHSKDLNEKVEMDIASLKAWIDKYYTKKAADEHYEHLVIPINNIEPKLYFLFNDFENNLVKGDFGSFKFGLLSEGIENRKKAETYLIKSFYRANKITTDKRFLCNWNKYYSSLSEFEGVFVFIESLPVTKNRFIIKSYKDLEPLVSNEFLSFLAMFEKSIKKTKNRWVPILIGYTIGREENERNIHWEALIFATTEFPNYVVKENQKWVGHLLDKPIRWGNTRNASYKYFFGRGKLNQELIEGKILILGVGAIGSAVATTLTRGGAKKMVIVDYDIKEPENVCRSEYFFNYGVRDKVEELKHVLHCISPYVDVVPHDTFSDFLKANFIDESFKTQYREILNHFDFIFDCTIDKDMAFMLDELKLTPPIINLSITNHAEKLICACGAKIYDFILQIEKQLSIEEDTTDWYNPTGCWSPTFKANYNDINVLVQYAIKNINLKLENRKELNSFILSTEFHDNFTIKCTEY